MSDVRERLPLLDRLEVYAASGAAVGIEAEDLRSLVTIARKAEVLNGQLKESTIALQFLLDLRQQDRAEIARLRAAAAPCSRAKVLGGAVSLVLALTFGAGVLAVYAIVGSP